MEFLDDSAEASAGQIEVFEAFFEGCRLFFGLPPVNLLVPCLPTLELECTFWKAGMEISPLENILELLGMDGKIAHISKSTGETHCVDVCLGEGERKVEEEIRGLGEFLG